MKDDKSIRSHTDLYDISILIFTMSIYMQRVIISVLFVTEILLRAVMLWPATET